MAGAQSASIVANRTSGSVIGQRHEDGPHPQAGQGGHDEVDGVRQVERDPITLDDAWSAKPVAN